MIPQTFFLQIQYFKIYKINAIFTFKAMFNYCSFFIQLNFLQFSHINRF